ncbi:MAG TPA: hypothetical protein VJ343_00100, partial [archaeon]|nr:hypothetical protein [archaeon]
FTGTETMRERLGVRSLLYMPSGRPRCLFAFSSERSTLSNTPDIGLLKNIFFEPHGKNHPLTIV